jgi:hypothetical protein
MIASSKAETARFWDQLLQFIEEGRVVPIVGQDLLVCEIDGETTLLYPYLATKLAEYLGVPAEEPIPEKTEETLNGVACRYLTAGGELEDVYSALKSFMPGRDRIAPPLPLQQLAGIRAFRLFVSTTFDSLLADAIDQVRFGGQPKTESLAYSPTAAEDLKGEIASLDRPVVFQLFGHLSAVPDYALTEEDVLEFVHSMQSETHRPQRLFDELGKSQLLILGSRFPDWLARFFLRSARRERLWLARGKTDVLADSRAREDAGLVLFLQHFSARTKVYQAGGAVELVDELARRWAERHPALPSAPELATSVAGIASVAGGGTLDMLPGAVFLSYASEDRPVVEAIREALESAGVDVWFDRDALKLGDAYEAKIRNNIEKASLFLPILSRHTLTPSRRFFRLEWDQAERVALQVPPSMRYLVPVAIDDIPPDEPALPERFRKINWVRLEGGKPTPDFVAAVRQLYRDYQKATAVAP